MILASQSVDIFRELSTKQISGQTFLVIKKKFALVYPKQHLKLAMVTTNNHSQNNIIKTTRRYLRSIGR